MRFLIDTSYDRASWHGPNLLGSLKGVTLPEACWRPARGRHNIWEIVVHAAYWKYVAWRRLTGAGRGAFPLKGSNWWRRPAPGSTAAWRADLALLAAMHQRVREAADDADAAGGSWLEERAPIGRATRRALLAGVAAHDIYHAGQIRLLRRLAADVQARGR